jgi:hypothetical protein
LLGSSNISVALMNIFKGNNQKTSQE